MTCKVYRFVSVNRFREMQHATYMKYDESRPELRKQTKKQKLKHLCYKPLLFLHTVE